MDVFYAFAIVQMVPNRAKRLIKVVISLLALKRYLSTGKGNLKLNSR